MEHYSTTDEAGHVMTITVFLARHGRNVDERIRAVSGAIVQDSDSVDDSVRDGAKAFFGAL
ncbi:MAG: hypothetical protein D6761_11185, partial [Candidatus Dadabacteria bacterium]